MEYLIKLIQSILEGLRKPLDGNTPLDERRSARVTELRRESYILKELAEKRKERLTDLWTIDKTLRNVSGFDLPDFQEVILSNKESFDINGYIVPGRKAKTLNSTLVSELSNIISSIFQDVIEFISDYYIDDDQRMSVDGKIIATHFDNLVITGSSEIEDSLKKLAKIRIKKFLNSRIRELSEQEISEFAEVLSNLIFKDDFEHTEEISNETIDRYLENYYSFVAIGNHNKEVRDSEKNYQDPLHEEESDVEEPKTNENSVKTLASILKKISQGYPLEDINDLFRNTIIIDDLFNQIDHYKLISESDNIEIYLEKVKEMKAAIFGSYLNFLIKELDNLGFEIINLSRVKGYETGYTDCTLIIENSNTGDRYEVQLQSGNTIEAKEIETAEYEKRKSLRSEVLQSLNNTFPSLTAEGENVRKEIESILIPYDDEKRNNLLKEFLVRYRGINEQDNINQEILTTIKNKTNSYLSTLANSRVWFGEGSFIQTEEDWKRVSKYIDNKYRDRFSFKGSKTAIPKEFEPDFEKFQNLNVRVVCVRDNKILLLQKSADSKNPFAFEFPGRSVNTANQSPIIEMNNTAKVETNLLNEDFLNLVTETSLITLQKEVGLNVLNNPTICQIVSPNCDESPFFNYVNPNPNYRLQPTSVILVRYEWSEGASPDPGRETYNPVSSELESSNHSSEYRWVSPKEYIEMLFSDNYILNGNTELPLRMLYNLVKTVES